MFEQTFRNIDDALGKEAGCATEFDYTEQNTWMLFTKYVNALEEEKATSADDLEVLNRQRFITPDTLKTPLLRYAFDEKLSGDNVHGEY